MRLKKLMAVVLSTALVATSLIGCGSKKDVEDNGEVTLRFSWWGGDTRHKATLEAIEKFEAKYPNIKVKPEYSGYDGIAEKMVTQMAGGTAPDVMQINFDWLTQFSNDGSGFYDLNSLKEDLKIDKNYDKENLEAGTKNGILNALPVSENAYITYYNKSTFDKFGAEIPKTWDELLDVVDKFDEGYYPITLGGVPGFFMGCSYVEQKTGRQFINDKGELEFTKEDIKEAVEFYKKLVDKGVTPSLQQQTDELAGSELNTAPIFLEGKFAGQFSWTTTIQAYSQSLKEVDQELVMGGLPIMEDAKASGIATKPSMLFAIGKNTKYPKESAMLMNFLLNDPEGVRSMGLERGIPISKTAIKTLEDDNKLDSIDYEASKYISERETKTISEYLELPEVSEIYTTAIEQFAYGEISIDKATDMIFKGIPQALELVKSK